MEDHLQNVERNLELDPRTPDLESILLPDAPRRPEATTAMITPDNPRDLAGYGRNPPHAQWPGRARIAVQFVLNYEEGGENCVLHGDKASETFLSEIVGAQAFEARHLSMESMTNTAAASASGASCASSRSAACR